MSPSLSSLQCIAVFTAESKKMCLYNVHTLLECCRFIPHTIECFCFRWHSTTPYKQEMYISQSSKWYLTSVLWTKHQKVTAISFAFTCCFLSCDSILNVCVMDSQRERLLKCVSSWRVDISLSLSLNIKSLTDIIILIFFFAKHIEFYAFDGYGNFLLGRWG